MARKHCSNPHRCRTRYLFCESRHVRDAARLRNRNDRRRACRPLPQENTVTGAADGYGRMAGNPLSPCCMLAADSPTAWQISTTRAAPIRRWSTSWAPTRPNHQPNFAEHEFINGNIVDLARVVSHWAHQAKSASDLAVLGAMAARYSRIGAGKICTVIAPRTAPGTLRSAPPVPAPPMETPKVSPQTVQEVVTLLTNGKKDGHPAGQPHAVWRGIGGGGTHLRENRCDLVLVRPLRPGWPGERAASRWS